MLLFIVEYERINMKKFILVFILLIISIILYARFIGTNNYKIVEHTIEIENLTCESLNTIINTAFNSLVSINTNTLTYNNTADLFKNSKNSFVNFPNPKFLSYEQSTGGSLIATANEYKINNNCKWSSIFGNDGGILSGYFWTNINEFLKDSIIENNFQYSSNSIQWADDALFPYLNKLNKNLPIGNGYNITFNFKEINNFSSITVIDFNESLSFNLTNFKDSNINFLNLNSFFINFNGINTPIIINLENLKQIKSQAFSDCSQLRSIYFKSAVPPTLERGAFAPFGEELVFFYPEEYKANWPEMLNGVPEKTSYK